MNTFSISLCNSASNFAIFAKYNIPYISFPVSFTLFFPMTEYTHTGSIIKSNFFVQDQGWYAAAERYEDFIRRHKDLRILFLELGVGANTPVIIKYPFWQMTAQNPNATYACINYGEAAAPSEIAKQSICINKDISKVLQDLQ